MFASLILKEVAIRNYKQNNIYIKMENITKLKNNIIQISKYNN